MNTIQWHEDRLRSDLPCSRCRHPFSEHNPSSDAEINPCGWVSLNYSVSRGTGTHCTCYAFVGPDGIDPVTGAKARPALSEIGRQIDLLRAKIEKVGHDGLHTEACSKCRTVARLRERLSHLGGE